jgi:hypothetical protein
MTDKLDSDILQRAHGTSQGAIISMAMAIITKFGVLESRIKDLEERQCCSTDKKSEADNVQLPVSKVQDEVSDTPDSSEVPQHQVLQPTNKTTGKAKKGTARKANSRTR